MDILMKFASLDTYDDKMIVNGKWKKQDDSDENY